MLTACVTVFGRVSDPDLDLDPPVFARSAKKKMRIRAKRKRKGMNKSNFVEKEMCNANNFISSVQTSGIRIFFQKNIGN